MTRSIARSRWAAWAAYAKSQAAATAAVARIGRDAAMWAALTVRPRRRLRLRGGASAAVSASEPAVGLSAAAISPPASAPTSLAVHAGDASPESIGTADEPAATVSIAASEPVMTLGRSLATADKPAAAGSAAAVVRSRTCQGPLGVPVPDVPVVGLDEVEAPPVGGVDWLPVGVGVVGWVEGGVLGGVGDHGVLGLDEVQGVLGGVDGQLADGLGEIHDQLGAGVEGRVLLGHVEGWLLGEVHGWLESQGVYGRLLDGMDGVLLLGDVGGVVPVGTPDELPVGLTPLGAPVGPLGAI